MPAEGTAWARVVDASALGAVFFDEPEADQVVDRLKEVILVAPAMIRFELANICWKKIRREPERRDALLAAHALAEQVAIHEVEVRFGEVLDLAVEKGITAYDASYLWLARLLDLDLVTLDGGLAQAATEERSDENSPSDSNGRFPE
ncbi:MAG TPA: type II toxin-antitoxin system VapC family toxin [Thermoanaerobaculia bacterium]|nr:type II toxin-antitoxin system VapC family toxin [Thermoanaerobaculia bacterium]